MSSKSKCQLRKKKLNSCRLLYFLLGVCSENQWTDFYMIGTFVMKEWNLKFLKDFNYGNLPQASGGL